MREHLPLRDRLALDRTDLANRRTWLASARTGLALFVSGASFLQFFDDAWAVVVGFAFMVLSAPVVVHGAWRFRNRQRQLLEDARRSAEGVV